jgi:hypothetical protein
VKTCFRCGNEKSTFVTDPSDRHYGMCQDCDAEVRSDTRTHLEHTETHRTCYLCRRTLPVESFTRRANGRYFSACKQCNKYVLAARRRAATKESK